MTSYGSSFYSFGTCIYAGTLTNYAFRGLADENAPLGISNGQNENVLFNNKKCSRLFSLVEKRIL